MANHDIHDVTPSAPAKDDVEDPNTRPSNYGYTGWQQMGPPKQLNPTFNHGIHPPMIQTNAGWYPPGIFDLQNLPQAKS